MYLLGVFLSVFVYTSQVNSAGIPNDKKSIVDEPQCGDVRTICNNLSENDDLLILECLQSVNPNRLSNLNEVCQKTIWSHMRDLTSPERVKDVLLPICRNYLDKVDCKIDNGSYLKCLINNKNAIQDSDCVNTMIRLENVAFQDYRWISSFLEHCNEDINKLSCGKFDEHSWGQIKTLSCLQSNIDAVKVDCKKEVFKLSELQSDSIKFDSQLYINCAEDHGRYCSQYYGASGRVFQCLMQQDPNKLMQKCRQQLLRRQKLISQDYKVSKGLMKACKEDIKRTHCRKQTSTDKTVRLAQILLCLENVVRNGSKILPDCEAELVDHRRMLMEDYRLSPEIVDGCKAEIAQSCKGFEVGGGGKTIHCLMQLAMNHNQVAISDNNIHQIEDKCLRALESLVKETNVGEDWHVDPVLHDACQPVVKTLCKGIKGGDARVMSCLMDNVGADQMTDDCEDALMQIQYFVARDFKLDPQLYRACKNDAQTHCHLWKDGGADEEQGPSYNSQVFACLYRHAIPAEDGKQLIQKSCLQQIRRAMRQRAVSVNLQPEIEQVCLNDLGRLCHDKTEKGAEMLCLQNNLEDLDTDCQNAVEPFTELEAEHAELNPYISKHCRKEMETICKDEYRNDEGDLMECLIAHKNDPSIKSNQPCRASIEHFQIVSIKDLKFTYKFKMACRHVAQRLCETARTKTDVVQCLSEQILNYTVHGVKSPVPRECKQQLKAQLLQQRENIDLDPKLKAACDQDIRKFCAKVSPGNSDVLECLQTQRDRLMKRCSEEIFKVKKIEMFDNSVDYALNNYCVDSIDRFCPQHSKETILDCLKQYKDEKGFNKKCRSVVVNRMIEQDTNYQLNPSLQQKCNPDIKKFCLKEATASSGKDSNSQNSPVIRCLKERFKRSELTSKCEKEVASILREQALNVNLNPLIRAVCKNELNTVCSYGEEEGEGGVEECLKDALLHKKIQTPECSVEVANMIVESQADIQVDPLLQRACALDLLNFCGLVPQGNGRHIQCLQSKLQRTPHEMSPICKEMLTKRLQMYKNAQNALPENLQQLYSQVVASPSKHYFFLVIMMLFSSIFVIGMFCGRVTRKHRLIKNK
ncbi:unnamed protein product [Brassicogethes aeneus]|uniref:Golgi apparatus protein 1 n=1 Tax=Brassicogethes aeneus TaxID=1431903 RepID=A0A9P0B8T9_BRAAE|nr:unnamed protein product [Brassicogethes aeneus]